MAKRIDSFASWKETYWTIDANIGMNLEFLVSADYSDDPDSGYKRAQRNIEELYEKLKLHAVVGLKLIDDQIASSEIMTSIAKLSDEARAEADSIKNAAKTIDNLSRSIGKVTKVVNKFMSLPFVSLV